MTKLNALFLEPVNTLTHIVGALLALVGTAVLLVRTTQEPGKMAALLIYGVSMILLFTASALLHGVRASPETRMWLNRFDHAAIFLLIAGTYTPILYDRFPAGWRWPLLILIWGITALGIVAKLRGRHIHGFVNVFIYVVIGWGGVVPLLLALALAPSLSLEGIRWLLLGGLIYSIGFVIYYWHRPDPWPGVFGHHEIWHLFVLAGSLCHYLFMLRYIAS